MSDVPSTKPYLIRAIYEWCVDAGFTPFLAVAVDARCRVPTPFVKDGQIVLNIAPHATNQFQLDNEAMSCQARFGGVAQTLYVPIDNISAIYARENGQGMAFEVTHQAEPDDVIEPSVAKAESQAVESTQAQPEPQPPGGGPRSRLRVIK
ncbi:ClpXP protease specificity-enhancing factor [Niveibacterium sp. SC-1]|uniref:ClpXP protease specificity-enhancing factor n=1 Tax=Niveibacterium sp. SC-1 TaxID=3135646 RepID=UPI00311D6849